MRSRRLIIKNSLLVLIYVFLASVLSQACKKQAPPATNVPPALVDLTLYINEPTNFKIQTIGGWLYYSAGTNGLIIYRKSQQEVITLERTSTADPNNPKARAIVQNDNFTCKDTISGSTWQIVDGGVMSGPATLPLKQYPTSFDGNVIRIKGI